MQTRKVSILKATTWKATILLASIAVIYGAIIALDRIYPDKFYNCERDTKDLNGGTKIYRGKKYSVILCGTGGDESFMHDHIRIQIFSETGNLLAQRKFYVDWQTNFPRQLEYGPNYLTYFDATQQSGFEHRINMPPTWLDWIRARLPFMN